MDLLVTMLLSTSVLLICLPSYFLDCPAGKTTHTIKLGAYFLLDALDLILIYFDKSVSINR